MVYMEVNGGRGGHQVSGMCSETFSRQRMAGGCSGDPGSEGEPAAQGTGREGGERMQPSGEELRGMEWVGQLRAGARSRGCAEKDRVRMRPGSETTGTAFTLQLQKGHLALPSMRCCIGNFISPPKAHNFSNT